MKKLLVGIAALALSGVVYAADITATTPATGSRIGIVDVRQVLQKSPQIAEMQKKLQDQFSSREKEIQSAQQQFQQDADKLNRDSSVMTANDRDALTKKLQAEQQNLRNMQMSLQKDVYAKQNEEMQTVLNQVQGIVAKVAQKNNLSLVVVKDAVAYASNEVDITSQVIDEMPKK